MSGSSSYEERGGAQNNQSIQMDYVPKGTGGMEEIVMSYVLLCINRIVGGKSITRLN